MRPSKAVVAARSRLYASEAQVRYLRILLNEAFAKRFAHGTCIDPHHMERVTKAEASAAIGLLKAAKARNWESVTEGE